MSMIDNEYADYSSSDASSRPPLPKRRKIGKTSLGVTNNDANDKFTDVMEEMNGHLGSIAETMLRSNNREELLATQKKMLLSEISMLQGVSEIDAIDATRAILRSPGEIDVFFSCPNDHWKKLYVQRSIVRLRGSSGASED